MKINEINSNQSFKRINISKNMPNEIVQAIKSNSVIKKAGKNYSLRFFYPTPKDKFFVTSCLITTPNTDTFLGLMLAPPHSIKREWVSLGKSTKAIMDSLEGIKNTPDFFEKKVGTPRTFKQKITAFLEAFKIAFMPLKGRTKEQNQELQRILSKYENINMPK